MCRQAIKHFSLVCVALFVVVRYAWTEERAGLVEEMELREASNKAIKLIQHSQVVWYKKQTCVSCHHQLLTEITIDLARERGVGLDETVARDTTAAAFAHLKDLDSAVQGYDYIDVFFDGWTLLAASAAGVEPTLSTAAYAQLIASQQLPDGSWRTIDDRPPQAHSRFAATAVCIQAVRKYLPENFKDERQARERRAREWLLKTHPGTTEDRAFQILGLLWTGADENARKNLARKLLAEQGEDGGWSQLPGMASDAYATGQTMFALREGANLSSSDPAYQRGLRFLLKTQQPDGSWRVKSRLHPPAPVSPPYVDTEFPYQRDQFISIMGTSWAVNALLRALPPKKVENSTRPALPDIAPAENAEWIRSALIGRAGDLKKLLDGGMNPNSKTAGGTTALMLAARDLEKVKLLLERGADVNARATTGFTPLMLAARHRGNADVVRLLLMKGANPNAEKGIEIRNDATALFFAVTSGDVRITGSLLDSGARLSDRMKLLGNITVHPLFYAISGGDTQMVEHLISRGGNPNQVDDDGISLLGWATINNHAETAKALLARGAQVNHVDKFGMTPLLYAASIDFGDTAMIEKLIAAGADQKARNKQGLTALDLARNYNHASMAQLLVGKAPRR